MMKKINFPKPVIFIIRLIGIVCLLLLIFIFTFDFWFSPHTDIDEDNIHKYIGSDMWKEALDKFDTLEIESLPVKKSDSGIYDCDLKIHTDSKDKWLTTANDIRVFVSDWLADNQDSEINDFDIVTVSIYTDPARYERLTFRNAYGEERFDSLNYVSLPSSFDTEKDNGYGTVYEAEEILLDDLKYFSGAEYLNYDGAVDADTDFSVLYELTDVKELSLNFSDEKFFATDSSATYANDIYMMECAALETKIKNMDLPYEVCVN